MYGGDEQDRVVPLDAFSILPSAVPPLLPLWLHRNNANALIFDLLVAVPLASFLTSDLFSVRELTRYLAVFVEELE